MALQDTTWQASVNAHDVNKYLVVVDLKLRLDALALCTAGSLLNWRLSIPHRVEALWIWQVKNKMGVKFMTMFAIIFQDVT